MEKKRYVVPVFYQGMANFVIEVEEHEDAKIEAEKAFKNGTTETSLGNEYETVSSVGTPELLSEFFDSEDP